MNRTFKVVFNKARGALTVVNEATSSIQAKGSKMILATACAIAAVLPMTVQAAEIAVTDNVSDQIKENGYGAVAQVTGDNYLSVSDGLTFERNHSGKSGGVFQISSTTTASNIGNNVTFKDNESSTQGGALHLQRAENTTIGDGVKFIGNRAGSYAGGAIYQESYTNEKLEEFKSSLTIGNNAYFEKNKSTTSHGGAIFNFAAGTESKIEIGSGAQFVENEAVKTGGAISNWGATINLGQNAKFEYNKSQTNGGAIYNSGYEYRNYRDGVFAVADGATFSGNEAVGNGGAIYNDEGGIFTLGGTQSESTLSGNSAVLGGAIFNAGELTVINSTFENNTATRYGGAIAGSVDGQGEVTVNGGAFNKNKALGESASGGAIALWSDGATANAAILTVTGTTFEGNEAGRKGGAVAFLVNHEGNQKNSTATFEGVTFTGNTAGVSGGAMHFENVDVAISGSTFIDNDATTGQGGAIFVNANGSLKFNGTNIFSENTAGGDLNDIYNDGSITVESGETALNSGLINNGVINITGGNLSVVSLNNLDGSTLTVSGGGTLTTSSDQALNVIEGSLFAATQDAAQDATGVSLKTGLTFVEGGELALTDEGYYTAGSLTQMVEALKTNGNNGTIVIVNAEFAPGKAGESGVIVDNIVQATVDANVGGTVSDKGAVTITPTNAGVQSVTVTNKNAESLVVGSEGKSSSFTLTGSAEGGQLVKNEADEALAVSVASGSKLTLGSNAIESETKGSLGSLTVSGTAEVVNMAANVETLSLTEGGKFTVGNASDRGSVDVEKLEMAAGSSIFLDPEVFGTVADASHFGVLSVDNIAGEIVAGQNSVVSLGATSAEGAEVVTNVLNRNGLTWGGENGITAAVYVGSAVTIADTGYVVADGNLTSENFTSASAADYSPGTLSIGANALLAANQAGVSRDETLVNGKVAFSKDSTLAIVNATEGEFNLASQVTGEANVITDNPFYAAQLEGSKVVTSQDTANGVASIASAGIQAMTRRADFMLSQTVADRASVDQEMQPGVNLWVDVAGENYQMDGMDYGAEFEADTFYGSFGGDIKLGDAYTVGAAFQYGDGSLRSSVNGAKNDVTNYGLALYGTAKFGDAKVVGELSYIWGENDITAAQSAMNQSVDTAVYSAGVTGMYELRAGGFSFVPSIGLRISQLETDAMRVGDVAIADQDQTLVQIPVALRINGADMTAGGWKLAPSFKIAYVPTFGDTEINVRNIETDVIDTSPVQMDFGLRAGTDNLLINAAFSLGAGKEGSSSIGGKVGLKYAF